MPRSILLGRTPRQKAPPLWSGPGASRSANPAQKAAPGRTGAPFRTSQRLEKASPGQVRRLFGVQIGLKVTVSYAMFDVPTPIGVKVTISYAMFDVPTSGPNPAPFFEPQIRLKVTISYAMFAVPAPDPSPDQKVTISYAMFDVPTLDP